MVLANAFDPSTLDVNQLAQPNLLRLQDGRRMAYQTVGHPNGRPVFFFHGSPGSRLEILSAQAAAIAQGWYLIAPDRPGMGQSDFKPGYTLLDYTHDILELADSLGVDRFGVSGHSGGGVTVLSCAYAIPERLDFAFDLGGWAPVTVPELQAHMTSIDRFFAERCIPQQKSNTQNIAPIWFQVPFTALGLVAKAFPPAVFIQLLHQAHYFCDADGVMLSTSEAAKFLVSTVRESFRQGGEGPAYDALLRYQAWGFELADIAFPVHIFHGTADISAPYRFAEYKHQHLSNSQLHTYPNEGHFFLWSHWADIAAIANPD